MDFLVSLVGRTLLNLKTFLDGTEMMEDSLYEGQMCYIPEEVKEDKNFVEKIVYVSPIRHAEGNFYLSQILAYPEMYEQMLQVLKEYDEDIISINYDDNERRIGKGTYKILSKSNKKALPLNVYGDGMKKAILLMSAVIAAKDGILLLDEFKTAIHTSAKGITGGEFWVTESRFLNDSTEFTIGTDICIEILEKHMRNPRRLLYAKDLLMEQMRKYYREEQEDTVSGSAEGSYVISFCTSGDSLLMWSEYSDFMGYCMEFEYGKLKETFQEYCGNDCTLFDGKVIYDHDEQTELLEDTIERLLLSDGEDYKTIHGWDDLDSAEEEDVKLFVDHISVICLLYNMFFKKECFAQEQEYRMVFLCVHKREHQVPENSIPVEYRIKDEVFIPFIRMKLGDISCLKSVCVGTKNTSDLAVKGLRHYFGSRNLEVRVRKSEIPLRY